MPTNGHESAADELYGLPPSEFVAARTRAAKALRSAGDREGAAVIQSLRRPTVSAWAVNQLARRKPKEVEELLGLGDRLRQAQRKALSGGGAKELQEGTARRRELVDRLVEAAGQAWSGPACRADGLTWTTWRTRCWPRPRIPRRRRRSAGDGWRRSFPRPPGSARSGTWPR